MVARLQALRDSNQTPPIGDVRGLGAMVAFEMVKHRGGHEPDADAAKALVGKALARGLVILPCGIYGNTIRLLAPLTLTDAHLDEGLSIIEHALKDLIEGDKT